MRCSRTALLRRIFLFLLLVSFLERRGRVAALLITENWYSKLVTNLPPEPPGGRHTVTPYKEKRPREFRGTFEGIDYDNPPHQVSTLKAKKQHYSCTGEYSRCILREARAFEACAYDMITGYVYNFHSVCDIEYANCVHITKWWPDSKQSVDFRFTRYIYDGDGWNSAEWWGWYCFEQDYMYQKGWRRAATAIARARRAVVTHVNYVKGLLPKTRFIQN